MTDKEAPNQPEDQKQSAASDASDMPKGRPVLFEIAWEVCQQVGGIYTVIRSKVPAITETWGKRYCLIGPWDARNSPQEFEETPATGAVGQAVKKLQDMGLGVHHGRWLIPGQPRVVLLDPLSAFARLGEIKYLLWEHHDIPTPADDHLVNLVVAFGWMVEHFLRAFTAQASSPRPVLAHFHEWMAGSAIGEIRRAKLPVSIVFTTHATLLGRYLAMNDPWFYDHVPFVNWLNDARRFNVESQVKLERTSAHGAHVFCTLSDITAYECEHLIGRKPDLLTPNGLNIERFVAMHEFQNLHRTFKQKIHQFVMGHFFPSYSFDLDKTVYMVNSGRYEYRNKGFDLTLEALARLNARMKQANIDRTVVFFFTTRRPYRSINAEALNSRAVMEEMRNTCQAIKDQIGEKLFLATAMGEAPDLNELIDDYWRLRLRRLRHGWRLPHLPAIITHDLVDDQHDDILNQLRASNLINRAEDKVKVIYHPEFITSADPLFGMDYDQFVRGCHLGVFPSYYEPWGYTPQECIARGVPAVTSDLAGFGTYVMQNIPDYESRGLFVVHRRMNAYDVAAEELTGFLLDFVQMDRRERIALRNRVESCSDQFDWGQMIKHYAKAYRMVTQRAGNEG